MTIDEAIKHCEEVAKEQDKLFKQYDDASKYSRSYNKDIVSANAKKCLECFECAKEHRQLAEWLKDYKRLMEQQSILDKIRAEIFDEAEYAYADFGQYKIDYLGADAEYVEDELPQDDFRYGMERAIEIIDKYKAESEDEE